MLNLIAFSHKKTSYRLHIVPNEQEQHGNLSKYILQTTPY